MFLIPRVMGNSISRSSLLTQKASPEILLAVGIVGVVGSTVLACRATLKVEDVLIRAKQKREDMQKTIEGEEYEYNEDDAQKDIAILYVQNSVEIVKLYLPAIIVGGLSIASLISSNRILSNRNVALTAAYSALDAGFRQYRSRVVDKYGEDEDRELRYGSEKVQIVDPETNRKKMVTRVSPDTPSIYSRFFDDGSGSWSKDPSVNRFFLRAQQNYFNDLLISRGHVFLNEVYKELGIPHSKEGAVVGWIISPESDNYVDFGIFEGKTQVIRDFWNGKEGSILLDFNVDGVIYDKI